MNRISVQSPTDGGKFAVARVAPGIMPTVECDGFTTQMAAARYAVHLNDEHAKAAQARTDFLNPTAERRIVPAFYDDNSLQ